MKELLKLYKQLDKEIEQTIKIINNISKERSIYKQASKECGELNVLWNSSIRTLESQLEILDFLHIKTSKKLANAKQQKSINLCKNNVEVTFSPEQMATWQRLSGIEQELAKKAKAGNEPINSVKTAVNKEKEDQSAITEMFKDDSILNLPQQMTLNITGTGSDYVLKSDKGFDYLPKENREKIEKTKNDIKDIINDRKNTKT